MTTKPRISNGYKYLPINTFSIPKQKGPETRKNARKSGFFNKKNKQKHKNRAQAPQNTPKKSDRTITTQTKNRWIKIKPFYICINKIIFYVLNKNY